MPKKTASPANAKGAKTKRQRTRATKRAVEVKDSKAKTSTPIATTGSGEDLVVFAIRLKRSEREAIHAAAGPGKATRFVRELSVAAARKDKASIARLLESMNAQS